MGERQSLVKHVKEHPFVGMSAFAASVHTAWAFGTLFSGHQPAVSASITADAGAWLAQTVALVLWLLPAISLAIALDVGMVETSMNIHGGHASIGRYATFAALAAGSYYMQMLHLAVHMPALDLSTAVAQAQADSVAGLRNAAVFIVPLLLQLPILLHVLSVPRRALAEFDQQASIQRHEHVHVHLEKKKREALQAQAEAPKALPAQARTAPRGNDSGEAKDMVHPDESGLFAVHCEQCGYDKHGYKSEASAAKAAAAHIGLWCKARQEQKAEVQ